MKYILKYIACLTVVSISYGQSTFQKTFHLESPSFSFPSGSVVEGSDGNIFICGSAYPDGMTSKTRLIKLDQFGETLWDTTYAYTSSFEFFPELIATKDGGVILADDSFSYPIYENDTTEDILVRKISAEGTVEWFTVLPARNFFDITATKDGGYILTGSRHERQFYSGLDIVVHKIDSLGNLIWTTALGQQADLPDPWQQESPNSIIEIDGDIYISGYHISTADFSTINGVFYKLDRYGVLQWDMFFSAPTGEDYRVYNAFKFQNEFYFHLSAETESRVYSFDPLSGSHTLVNDSLRITSVSKGYYYNIDCEGQNLTALMYENGAWYFKKYADLSSHYYSRQLNELPSNTLAELVPTKDGGHLILSDSGDSIHVTKLDCMGNITQWSGQCSTSLPTELSINVYPNPSFDQIFVEANFDFEEIYFYDYSGKFVHHYNTCSCSRQLFDISDLSSGVYLVKVIYQDQVINSKFVKV